MYIFHIFIYYLKFLVQEFKWIKKKSFFSIAIFVFVVVVIVVEVVVVVVVEVFVVVEKEVVAFM